MQAGKHAQSSHSTERLFPCVQPAPPIQTERSDEGVKLGQKIA